MQVCSPIQGEHPITCPSCKAPVYLVYASTGDTPGANVWLTDGDSVPKVHEHLRPDQIEGQSFECMLSVGNCHACSGAYYVVEAAFLDGPLDRLYDWLAGSFEEHGRINYVCTNPAGGDPWTLLGAQTVAGHSALHIHGPFALGSHTVSGPNGVAACGDTAKAAPWEHARDLLAEHWDAMRLANTAAATASSP